MRLIFSSVPADVEVMRRQSGRHGAATVAAVMVGGACLVGCGHHDSDAVTTVRGVTGVMITDPGGQRHPARDGEHLVVGDVVGTSGSATELDTGGRVTTLARSSTLRLLGRSSYELGTGSLVVNHRHGPGVQVHAAAVTVDDVGRTAVRITRGFSVLVAVYDGDDARVAAGQRRSRVPALHQVEVPGSALPNASDPLRLHDDVLDTAAAPDLVAVDRALAVRAGGLDGPGGQVVAVSLPAVFHRLLPASSGPVPDASTGPLSEWVLPVGIASAARRGAPVGTYRDVRALRADGGSWGVLAALVGAPLDSVENAITAVVDAGGASGGRGGSGTGPGGTGPGRTRPGGGLVALGGSGIPGSAAAPGSTAGAATPAGSRTPPATPATGAAPANGAAPAPARSSAPNPQPSAGRTSPAGFPPAPQPSPTASGVVGELLGVVGSVVPTPSISLPAVPLRTGHSRSGSSPVRVVVGGVDSSLGGSLGGVGSLLGALAVETP